MPGGGGAPPLKRKPPPGQDIWRSALGKMDFMCVLFGEDEVETALPEAPMRRAEGLGPGRALLVLLQAVAALCESPPPTP